jgi:hypothetical protein
MQEVTVDLQLTPESKRALGVFLRKPVAAGGEVAILANLKPDELYAALQSLLSAGLISADTSSLDPNGVEKAYFNLKPSARRFAEFTLR